MEAEIAPQFIFLVNSCRALKNTACNSLCNFKVTFPVFPLIEKKLKNYVYFADWLLITKLIYLSIYQNMLLTIQYLRAISILMVLTGHIVGGFGAQGVDIFFVISGFMMMHIMHERSQNYLEFFLQGFLELHHFITWQQH